MGEGQNGIQHVVRPNSRGSDADLKLDQALKFA